MCWMQIRVCLVRDHYSYGSGQLYNRQFGIRSGTALPSAAAQRATERKTLENKMRGRKVNAHVGDLADVLARWISLACLLARSLGSCVPPSLNGSHAPDAVLTLQKPAARNNPKRANNAGRTNTQTSHTR